LVVAPVFDCRNFNPLVLLKFLEFFSRQRLLYRLQRETNGLPATNAPGWPFKKK
jgi:hypothetical protein